MIRSLFVLLLSLALASGASAAVLEVPQNGGDASGIGYISGWKCPPNDNITVVIDNGQPIPVPSGVRRNDTSQACGNDGRNGYITQINFNLLGDGIHVVSARRNGQQFSSSSFRVTTLGTTFLTGVGGTYALQNFPSAGKTTTIDWDQGAQNFIITGTSSGPSPTPSPKPPTAAQVRYGNNLVCSGSGFTSILTAGVYSWASFSGTFSDYQGVNLSSIGPFHTSNGNCSGITYPGIFNLLPGRRYAFVQDLSGSNPVLRQFDEGSTSSADASANGDPAQRTEIVTVIGTPDESAAALGEVP